MAPSASFILAREFRLASMQSRGVAPSGRGGLQVAAVASRPRLLVPAHISSGSPVRVAAAPGGPVTTSSTEAEEVGAGAGAVFTGADGHASTIVPFRTTTTEPKTEPAAPVPDAKEPASWPSAAARRGLYSDVAVDRVSCALPPLLLLVP
jgi:hypothetical protein